MANSREVTTAIPTFRNRLQNKIKQIILQPGTTPKQIALSFAIGLSVAFSPIIGLHTCMIIIICLLFKRLHKPLLFLTCCINNPWTMLPIASISIMVGNLLMGYNCYADIVSINWYAIGLHNFISIEGLNSMYIILKPIILPYLIGGFALSALSLPISYYGLLKIVIRLRKDNNFNN